MPVFTYVYKVSNAGVSLAFIIAVSISACFVLTASLCVDIALGIAIDFSVFLVMYQSVFDNSTAVSFLIFLINIVFNPSTFTLPSVPKPSVSSCAVNKVSSCALAVAVPHDLVTWFSAKA